MTATVSVSRKFEVAGFTAEVSMPLADSSGVSSAVVYWSPRIPDFHADFSEEDRREYRRRLSALILEIVA